MNPTNPKPRLLITGACGRIGPRVIPFLEKPFDLKLTDWRPVNEVSFAFEPANLLDFDDTLRIVRGVDVIAHLAIASTRQYKPDGVPFTTEELALERTFNNDTLDVNIKGTYNLFEAARCAGVRRIVYMSSLTVVLGNPPLDAISEQTAPRPANLYACTKLFGEHLGEMYARARGFSVICLRLGQPYPLNHPYEKEWKESPRGRAGFVGFEDIARVIECAVCATPIKFGVYAIVSESAGRIVDLTAPKRDLGYVPRQFCDEQGNMIPNENICGPLKQTA